jgi:tRNA nucleotidyltransferase/poly(A) polymerase
MFVRVTGERIRHELYLILREREPERVLRRLEDLNVLAQIHPRLTSLEQTWARFAHLRQAVKDGSWNVQVEEGSQPSPALYLALLTCSLSRADLEAVARRLRLVRDDADLLHEVLDLRESEPELDRATMANREIYGVLRYSSTAAVLIAWLVCRLGAGAGAATAVRDRIAPSSPSSTANTSKAWG